jgi:hypothetical protein
MTELFPAKCHYAILHSGGSVWTGFINLAASVNTISENEVYQTQFCDEITVKFVENAGKVMKW